MNSFWKSVRWKLQLWHGLVLLAVLGSFGCAVYWLVWQSVVKRIDAELAIRSSFLVGMMSEQYVPHRGPPFSGARIPPLGKSFFGGEEPESFYYSIWAEDGTLLQASENAPDGIPIPEIADEAVRTPRTRGNFREFLVRPAERIQPPPFASFLPFMPDLRPAVPRRVTGVVGCSLTTLRVEQYRLALGFAAAGGLALFAGLAVGWTLTGPIIKPVSVMRDVAVEVSAGICRHAYRSQRGIVR